MSSRRHGVLPVATLTLAVAPGAFLGVLLIAWGRSTRARIARGEWSP